MEKWASALGKAEEPFENDASTGNGEFLFSSQVSLEDTSAPDGLALQIESVIQKQSNVQKDGVPLSFIHTSFKDRKSCEVEDALSQLLLNGHIYDVSGRYFPL